MVYENENQSKVISMNVPKRRVVCTPVITIRAVSLVSAQSTPNGILFSNIAKCLLKTSATGNGLNLVKY